MLAPLPCFHVCMCARVRNRTEEKEGSVNVTLNCHTVAPPKNTHTHTLPNEGDRGFYSAKPEAKVGETLLSLHPF